jgi:myo-inositol-1(or 4)-monophosphatase
MPSTTDLFLQTAVDSVRAAGEVALRRQHSLGAVRYKGKKDLVTEADLECDRLIRDRLQAAFPDHDMITEEEAALKQGSDYCWYVDPIDGTINYSHQIPLWGVSVGLARKGKVLCGAIYLPALGELYTAVAGGGAFLNGEPIRVSPCADLMTAIVSHGDFNVSADDAERERLNGENFWSRMRTVASVQRVKCLGSAAVEGAFVAAGRLDGYWMVYFKPWDVAVTTLLVAEAGGKVTDLQGNPWTLESGTALFSNGALHSSLLAALQWDRLRIPA